MNLSAVSQTHLHSEGTINKMKFLRSQLEQPDYSICLRLNDSYGFHGLKKVETVLYFIFIRLELSTFLLGILLRSSIECGMRTENYICVFSLRNHYLTLNSYSQRVYDLEWCSKVPWFDI